MSYEEEKLKESLISRKPILLVGAGFSRGAICKGKELPVGKTLKKEILNLFYSNSDVSAEDKETISKMNLPDLCRVIQREGRENELKHYLIDRFQGAMPSSEKPFHNLLCDYYWDKIYTLNIDDLIENIYNTNDIDYVVQNEKIQKPVDREKRQLIKLHGCVNRSEDGFIFSRDEYISNIANEDYRLKEFSQDCFYNDIIFLGTEFNEDDISVLIEKNVRSGFVINSNFFFVSPQIGYSLKALIKGNNNFYHVPYSTEQFLTFCSVLNKNEKSIVDQERLLEQYGGFQNIDKYKSVPVDYESKLYYGNKVTYYDIFADWDVVYSKISTIVNKILKFTESVYYIVPIYGKAFSGKTVAATRLLIELYKHGYNAYSYNCDGENELFAINEYLNRNTDIRKVAILIDDAAYLYGSIAKMVKKLPDHLTSLIFILVSSKNKHYSQKHELVELYGSEWELKDDFDDKMPRRVYYKLSEKNRLGKLSQLTSTQAIDKIKESKQLVEFLYSNTHGEGYRNYFRKKLDVLISTSSDNSVEIIKFLCILSKMGIHNVNQALVRLIYGNMNVDSLSDLVIGLNLTGNITLRCAESYDNYIYKMSSNDRAIIVQNTLVAIANMFREDENNRWKNVFEQMFKSRELVKTLKLDILDVMALFVKMEKYYSNTSYFWMQRGLLKQFCKEYDEADTFLNQALAIRPNSYQIRHALAKNKLEKAVYIYKRNNCDAGDSLYDQGSYELIKLIENPRFSNNIGHSVHSYISMTLKYYKVSEKNIEEEKILEMHSFLVRSSKQSYDKWMKRCRRDLYDYCKLHYPQHVKIFDEGEFNEFKKENFLKAI